MVDFICRWLSNNFDGCDIPCDELSSLDDQCENQCKYSSPQPECWKRYFNEIKGDAK